jgi:hypothetical protein
VQEYHLSPQSLALILYLCIWFFIISRVLPGRTPVARPGGTSIKKYSSIITYLLLILLSLSIVISHPGTPIFLIINAVVLYVALIVFKRLKKMDLKFNIFDMIILVLPFLIWLIFVTPAYLNQAITLISLTAISLFSNHATLVDSIPTITQPDQVFVNMLRQMVTIAESLIGFLCIILLLRKETRRAAIIFGGWFISCFAFQLFGFSQNFVSGRFLIFAIFPFALLVALLISRITKFRLNAALSVTAIIILIASALLIPLINYGGDYYEHKPLTSVYMGRYVASRDIPYIDIAVFGVEFLKTDVESLPNVYLVDGLDAYNLFRVKYSMADEYLGMFNKTGMSSIYTNGDYSLHGFINNSLPP